MSRPPESPRLQDIDPRKLALDVCSRFYLRTKDKLIGTMPASSYTGWPMPTESTFMEWPLARDILILAAYAQLGQGQVAAIEAKAAALWQRVEDLTTSQTLNDELMIVLTATRARVLLANGEKGMTVSDVAALSGLCTRRIRQLLDDGELKKLESVLIIQDRKVATADLPAFFRAQKVPGFEAVS